MTSPILWIPILASGCWVGGCSSALPPGCTEADYGRLATTCPSEAECNALIDERQRACAKKIEAE
jgi:hypothetical protein